MDCVSFAKIYPQVSVKKQNIKKILRKWKNILEKSGNFVSPKKVGTMQQVTYHMGKPPHATPHPLPRTDRQDLKHYLPHAPFGSGDEMF